VKDVDVPVYAIACETDHIAAWKDSFRGVVKMGSKNKTFVLSESGHIAGIVNPPSKKKYGHYTNEVSGHARGLAGRGGLQRRVLVAALGGVAGESVGQAGSGAHPR
jgi:hypothetical protein